MRRQDELLLVYAGQSKNVRKWILGQLDGLATVFDAQELFAFLLSQTQDEDARVRNQALFSLQLFLPPYVRTRHGVGPSGPLIPPNADALRRAALEAARPVVEALAAIAGHPDVGNRRLARMALAQYPVPEVQGRLLSEFAKSPGEFELLLAYVRATSASEMDRPLVELMKSHHQQEPDLLLLLAGAPAEAAVATAAALAPATDVNGRMNLAIALSHVRAADPRPAMQPLLAAGEGWVAVHALAALEATRNREALPLVAALSRHAVELVRIEAVRVAGAIGGSGALEICVEAARQGSPRLAAQALESLVQLEAPAQVVQPLAGQLLASPSPTARLAAVLAIEDPADPRVQKVLQEMALSAEPHDRLLAAFALGYLQSGISFKCLIALSQSDPCVPVRGQATKSLSKYPVRIASAQLFALLGDADPRIAASAGLALGRYGGDELKQVGQLAIETLGTSRQPGVRSRLYRLLGQVSARLGAEAAEEYLDAGLAESDPETLCGLLDGWKQLGRARQPEALHARLSALSTHANPAVAARAATTAVLLGRPGALDALVAGLQAADEVTVPTWLHHALDLGLALTEALPAGGFPLLAGALIARPPVPSRPPLPTGEGSGRPGLEAGSDFRLERSRVVKAMSLSSGRIARVTVAPPADDPPAAAATADEMANRLGEHLEKLATSAPAQGASVRDSIRKDSGHLEEQSSVILPARQSKPVAVAPHAPPLAPAAAAKPPAKRGSFPWKLLAGVAVIGLAAGAYVFVPRPVPDKSGLSVSSFSGPASWGPSPGAPIAKGELKPGTRIATGAGAKVQLSTAGGSVIDLEENAVLVAGAPGSDGDIEVRLEAGRMECEIKTEQFAVPFGDHIVEGLKGRFSVTIVPGKFRVVNLKGDVQVRLANGEVLSVQPTNAVALANPAAK